MAKRKIEFPKRGEIYLVNFDPTVGSEIQKTRPALILQNDITSRLAKGKRFKKYLSLLFLEIIQNASWIFCINSRKKVWRYKKTEKKSQKDDSKKIFHTKIIPHSHGERQ